MDGQAGLRLCCSHTPEDRFFCDKAQIPYTVYTTSSNIFLKQVHVPIVKYVYLLVLTLYSIIAPFDAFEISCTVFENMMENGAFALFEKMLHFP